MKSSNKEADLLPTTDKSLEWSELTWWELKITGMRTMQKKDLKYIFIYLVQKSFVLNYLSRGNYSLIFPWEASALKSFLSTLAKSKLQVTWKKNYFIFSEIYLIVSVFLRTSLWHCPPFLSLLIGFFFGLRVSQGRNTSSLCMKIFVIDFTMGYFLIEIDKTLWEKTLKIKVKASDIFGAKIYHFLFRQKFLAFFHLV